MVQAYNLTHPKIVLDVTWLKISIISSNQVSFLKSCDHWSCYGTRCYKLPIMILIGRNWFFAKTEMKRDVKCDHVFAECLSKKYINPGTLSQWGWPIFVIGIRNDIIVILFISAGLVKLVKFVMRHQWSWNVCWFHVTMETVEWKEEEEHSWASLLRKIFDFRF